MGLPWDILTRPELLSGGRAAVPSSLLTGLEAYWAFSSGSFLTDSTANANTLTNSGVTQSTSGILGDCASCGGSSSASVADNASIDFTSKLSISAWFNATSLPTTVNPISKGILSSSLEWAFRFTSGTHPAFFLGDTGLAISASANGFTAVISTWYHVAIVYDGTQTGNSNRVKMWVNGASQTLTFGGTFPAANTPQAGGFFLGQLGGGTPQYWVGLIDEVGLWNVALTSTQVGNLYNSGGAVTYPFAGVP
jgi:Concanavalin A-like lectin/glucanases superfamily